MKKWWLLLAIALFACRTAAPPAPYQPRVELFGTICDNEQLRVHVEAEDGSPVVGANVIVFWPKRAQEAPLSAVTNERGNGEFFCVKGGEPLKVSVDGGEWYEVMVPEHQMSIIHVKVNRKS